jgi:hypothetical protein
LIHKKSLEFDKRSGLQLPRDVCQIQGYGTILTMGDLVNYRQGPITCHCAAQPSDGALQKRRLSRLLNMTQEQEEKAAASRLRRLSQPSQSYDQALAQTKASLIGKTVPVKGYDKAYSSNQPTKTETSQTERKRSGL